MGNAAAGQLPFDVGEEVTCYASGSQGHWKMHKGTKKASGEPVTIFRMVKKTTAPLLVGAGQRGFQKLRGLRHPYILACLDGADLEGDVVMATEEVVPLQEWLATRIQPGRKDDQVAWGMHCMCSALKFLHESCRQSHNNVCPEAIFVTRGGDWKLGGMDLLSAVDGSDPFLMIHQAVQPRDYQSPERRTGSLSALSSMPIHIQDIWSLGKVLQSLYPEGAPAALSKYLDKMMDANAAKRPTPAQYLRCAFLKRPAVQHLQTLEDWSVQSAEDKAAFLRGQAALTACPRDALTHKLSALLIRDIEMAVAAAPAPGGAAAPRAVVAVALPPLLDIEGSSGDAALSARVEPLLVSLLTMNDRGVRAMLLSKVDAIAPRLDAAVVNGRLFEPLCAGFMDAAAQLRELTLKSMVVFTDKLSDKNLNDRLVRHLARLQGDPEDSIRTNTIIFLGKIAGKLKPAVRDKVLLSAFARGIRDPFPAARLAGLRATAACAAYCEPLDVCARVLPVVVPCLVDPASHAVREAAFACVELYLGKLREVSENMKVQEEEQKAKAAAFHGAGALPDSASTPPTSSSAPATAAAPAAVAAAAPTAPSTNQPTNSWSSWAINILSEKLASSTAAAPPAAATTSAPPTSTSTSTTPPASSVTSTAASPPPPRVSKGMQLGGGGSAGRQAPAGAAGGHGLASDEDEWADANEFAGDGWDDLDGLSDADALSPRPRRGSKLAVGAAAAAALPPAAAPPVAKPAGAGVDSGARRVSSGGMKLGASKLSSRGSLVEPATTSSSLSGSGSGGPGLGLSGGSGGGGYGAGLGTGGGGTAVSGAKRVSLGASRHSDATASEAGGRRGSVSSLDSGSGGSTSAPGGKAAGGKAKRLGVMKLSDSKAKASIADGWDDF